MTYPQNDWAGIRKHYAMFGPKILAHRKNEWAVDAYSWDAGKKIIYMTPIEWNFWADARNANAIVYPQWPAQGYFIDFANPVARVGIECDGAAFHKDAARDALRQSHLEKAGWTIYRISGRDCNIDYNEETGEESPGKQLIDRICRDHDIKRVSGGTGCIMSAAELVDQFLEEMKKEWGVA